MVACSGRIMVKHAGIKLHLIQCHSFNCILFIISSFLVFSKTKKQKGGKRLFVLLLWKM